MFKFFAKKRAKTLLPDVRRYIEKNYEEYYEMYSISEDEPQDNAPETEKQILRRYKLSNEPARSKWYSLEKDEKQINAERSKEMEAERAINRTISEMIRNGIKAEHIKSLHGFLPKTFIQKVAWHIDSKGWKDSRVYKKALISRQLFSKMMSDKNYHPSKDTAIRIALALELPLESAEELLSSAGYALSNSREDELVTKYFISHRIYDVAAWKQILYEMKTL